MNNIYTTRTWYEKIIKYLKYGSKLQLIYSFKLIINFLFNIYIIKITSTSSVSRLSTNWANSWSSTSRFTAWLRCRCVGSHFGESSMLVQLTRLCPTCLQFEQIWWRRLPLSPVEGILVVRSRPACFHQIGGLTTTNLIDSGTSIRLDGK